MSRFLFLSISIGMLIAITHSCNKKVAERSILEVPQEKDTSTFIKKADQPEPVPEVMPAPMPLPDTLPKRILSYGKTGCFGNCPAFEFHVFEDGTVIYTGKRAVKRMGYLCGIIDRTKLKSIFMRAKELGIQKLLDNYPPDKSETIVDLPSTYTLILFDNGYKQIRHNYGGPDELIAFEKYIDKILFGVPLRPWKKQ